MTTMTETGRLVTGGFDTHADVNVAAVDDDLGRVVGSASFPTTETGHRQLLRWLRRHGQVC